MDRLPNELLVHIGEYAREEKTLPSLILCSRRFHKLLQPVLYSHIAPDWSIHFLHLIMRLCRNPELARQVRHLELRWTGGGDIEIHENKIVGLIDDSLDEIFEPEEEESRNALRKYLLFSRDEAWFGLLLVHLPYLVTLTLKHPLSDMMSDILQKAARRQRPFHQTPPFPYLREVRVDGMDGSVAIQSDFLTPFFYFPSVRKISGGPISESFPDDPHTMSLDISHSVRPVREITVSAALHCHGMLDWLASSTELEHVALVLSVDGLYPETVPENQFNAPEFRKALLPFTKTLKTLRLEADYVDLGEWLSNIADDAGPFGSLKEFAVLENLRMRYALLVQPSPVTGVKTPLGDVLPSSLKSLEVLEIENVDHLDLVLDFSRLVQCRASFPQLERVTLYVKEADGGLKDSLRPGYEAAGIDFQVTVLEPRVEGIYYA